MPWHSYWHYRISQCASWKRILSVQFTISTFYSLARLCNDKHCEKRSGIFNFIFTTIEGYARNSESAVENSCNVACKVKN